MNKVFAIAGIALRNAVRSRIVMILLCVLLLVIVGLPLTVKSDGTVAGHVRILLGYTLGLVSFLLSLATLWAGCAAVSLEIQEKQIHLIVTKPVRRAQIWLGKWLGLVTLNAALLAFSGVVVYVLLKGTTRPEKMSAEQRAELRDNVLIACNVLKPEPIRVDDAAFAELKAIQARSPLSPNIAESEVLKAIKTKLLTQAYSVPQGGKRQWKFDAPAEWPANHPLLFRFRFSSSSIGPESVPGRWTLKRESGITTFQIAQTNTPGVAGLFQSPSTAVAGGGKCIVEYENLSASPLIVVFDSEDGLQLFCYSGSFESNLARALLAILFRLAFFAALGVTAGSLFSMPVASFTALCALFMMQISGYIQSVASQDVLLHSHYGEAHGPTLWDYFFRVVFQSFSAVAGPLQGPDPLELLTSGRFMTGAWLGSIFLVQIVVYSGVLLALSAWVLNKRELALPA
jgi:hypothetical protein